MPKPTAMPIRIALWNATQGGESPATLAERFCLPIRTVRHLLVSFRQAGAVVAPAYCPGSSPPCFDDLVPFTVALRRVHPTWGAGMLRVQLARQFPTATLPHPRSIQRWLQRAGLAPAHAGRKREPRQRATCPHEVWEVDAADQLRLANNDLVSWLRLTDEHSGAILQTVVFPCVWNKVSLPLLQQTLRRVFTRWGLPQALRLDNGYPWGIWSSLPTALALWLIGTGVDLKFNPPRRPRDNGVVERSHGVTKSWAEVPSCPCAKELQERIDDLDKIQREEYAVSRGKSRWELFAGLRQKHRDYTEAWEQGNWDMERAQGYLAEAVAERLVDKQGRVKVYARSYYMGTRHSHHPAFVQYDPEGGVWVFSNTDGVQWCRHPADQITASRICQLDISAKLSHNHGKTSCPD